MDLPSIAWKPQTLRDAHFASALNIGIKEGFGSHLPPPRIHTIIGAALARTEPSLRLRLHAALVDYFNADPIVDRSKIEAALNLMSDVLEDYESRH